ncbi:NAD(P)H-dependent oxidoreductase [soil metagenome]
MSLVENLNWRYATKKMTGKTIPQEKLQYILDAAHLAPSSSGLQPYSIIVISNKELLEKIKPIAMNQGQITDASHLLVFAAWNNYTEEKIAGVFDTTVAQRGLPANTMDEYKDKLWGMYSEKDESWHFNHASRQAYISFALAIAAAAEQKVDATPMEGFNPAALDELLGLNERGLKSTVILALGYRDEPNDWLANMKKVRTPSDRFFIELN